MLPTTETYRNLTFFQSFLWEKRLSIASNKEWLK